MVKHGRVLRIEEIVSGDRVWQPRDTDIIPDLLSTRHKTPVSALLGVKAGDRLNMESCKYRRKAKTR